MCNCNKNREVWEITLQNGLHVTKPTEAAARVYASKHPGATYKKKDTK